MPRPGQWHLSSPASSRTGSRRDRRRLCHVWPPPRDGPRARPAAARELQRLAAVRKPHQGAVSRKARWCARTARSHQYVLQQHLVRFLGPHVLRRGKVTLRAALRFNSRCSTLPRLRCEALHRHELGLQQHHVQALSFLVARCKPVRAADHHCKPQLLTAVSGTAPELTLDALPEERILLLCGGMPLAGCESVCAPTWLFCLQVGGATSGMTESPIASEKATKAPQPAIRVDRAWMDAQGLPQWDGFFHLGRADVRLSTRRRGGGGRELVMNPRAPSAARPSPSLLLDTASPAAAHARAFASRRLLQDAAGFTHLLPSRKSKMRSTSSLRILSSSPETGQQGTSSKLSRRCDGQILRVLPP